MAFIKHESSYQQEQSLKEQEYFLDCYQEKEKVQRMVMLKSLTEHGNLIKKQQDIGLFLEETSVMLSILLAGITTEAAKIRYSQK